LELEQGNLETCYVCPILFDLILIGSGLGAARWLRDNDVDGDMQILVLEGRNRIGGRVFTSYSDAGEANSTALGLFDLGASWLHDPGPTNPVSIMAECMGLPLKVLDWENDWTYNLGGREWPDKEVIKKYKKFEEYFFAAVKEARSDSAKNSSKSLEEIQQKKNPEWNHPLTQLYASVYDFDMGTALRNCSATESVDADWIRSQEEDEDEDFDPIFPVTGFSAIINGLLSGEATDNELMRPKSAGIDMPVHCRKPIDALMRHKVVAIDQSNESRLGDSRAVIIRCFVLHEDGSVASEVAIDADAVICTIPLGVLKDNGILFSPPLSEQKRIAIDSIGVGNVVKIIIEFPVVFWQTSADFLCIADEALGTFEGTDLQTRGLLTLFLNGHKACGKKILIGYGLGDAADIIDSVRYFMSNFD
jgi:hypothetical protein